jgi:nitroreductase
MPLPPPEAIAGVFRERRSCRVFLDEPVPRPVVRELVDLARYAPSASNAQSVDWLAIDDPQRIGELSRETVAVLAQTAALLRNRWIRPLLNLRYGAETIRKGLENASAFEQLAQRQETGEDPIFHCAPVVLVAHVPRGDYFGRDNAAYAAYNLILAAHRKGLGTCLIGFLKLALDRSEPLGQSLGLDPDRQAEAALVLGHPAFDFHRVLERRQPDLVWNDAP